MGGDEAGPSLGRRGDRGEAEESRRELDEVPEHGTDPLHEGP